MAEPDSSEPHPEPDPINLLAGYFEDLKRYCMPFGRYGPDNFPPHGKPVHDLPLDYLIWFKDHGGGFPRGRLGELMQFIYEVKVNGAEEVLAPLRNRKDD